MGKQPPQRALAVTARVGYAARGAVYALVGALVLWSLTRGGGRAPGARTALDTLAETAPGQVVLYAIAGGLGAHAAWRIIQGVCDVDELGHGAKAILGRTAAVASGLVHLWLGWSAVTIARGLSHGAGVGTSWATQLMAVPWGQWLVGAIGAAIIVAGLVECVRGWQARFLPRLRRSRAELGWLRQASVFGLIARGVVFVVIGALLVEAAVQLDASGERGLRGAFAEIIDHRYGVVLLAITGAGMIAFAVYSFVLARYRSIGRI